MVRIIVLLALFVGTLAGSDERASAAEPCANLKSIEDIFDALNSKDRLVVIRGMKCGLLSEDRGARGLVIYKYLSDGATDGSAVINIVTDVYDGDTDAAAVLPKLPNFSIWGVHWSPGGHQFIGTATFCCQNSASGNLIGDKLTISYQNWPLPADKDQVRGGSCTASLQPNEQRTELEGQLRCQGIALRFKASIGM